MCAGILSLTPMDARPNAAEAVLMPAFSRISWIGLRALLMTIVVVSVITRPHQLMSTYPHRATDLELELTRIHNLDLLETVDAEEQTMESLVPALVGLDL